MKRKAVRSGDKPKEKKRRVETVAEDDEDGDSEPQGDAPSASTATKHRVTAKGTNVPECIDRFEALKSRYTVPSLLFTNLISSGYLEPTAIQASAVPILLEVRSVCVSCGTDIHLCTEARPGGYIADGYGKDPCLLASNLCRPRGSTS